MGPRQRAYDAFQKSEGASLEPSTLHQRRVRARAAPPTQPVPPPAGPRPNARQFGMWHKIQARANRQFSDGLARNGLALGSTLAERTATALAKSVFVAQALSDCLADLEDQLERQDNELAEAKRTIADLTARLARLEDIERADTRAARAIAGLKASRAAP